MTLSEEKQKEMFEWFFENLGDGFSILDEDLRYIYVNKEVLDRRGSNLEDFIGQHITDVHLDLKNSDRFDTYRRVLETGEPMCLIKHHPTMIQDFSRSLPSK